MTTLRTLSLIIILACLSFSLAGFTLHPRVKSGLNISQHYGIDYGYDEYEVEKGIRWGFTGGISFDFPVSEAVTVSQEFLFTTKGSSQVIGIADQPIEMDVTYKTDYLEFPTLLLLHHYRRNNFTVFYQTGFSFSYLINSHYEIDGTVETGTEDYPLDIDKRMKNIDQFDFGIILGGGIGFSISKRSFILDYRTNFGIPFIEFPTTEDVLPETGISSRVRLRNLSYSLSLSLLL
jgi:hypothetical protein